MEMKPRDREKEGKGRKDICILVSLGSSPGLLCGVGSQGLMEEGAGKPVSSHDVEELSSLGEE